MIKAANSGLIAVKFVYSRQQEMLISLKTIKAVFLHAVAAVKVLKASNTDLKRVETRTVHFARLKSSSRLRE